MLSYVWVVVDHLHNVHVCVAAEQEQHSMGNASFVVRAGSSPARAVDLAQLLSSTAGPVAARTWASGM